MLIDNVTHKLESALLLRVQLQLGLEAHALSLLYAANKAATLELLADEKGEVVGYVVMHPLDVHAFHALVRWNEWPLTLSEYQSGPVHLVTEVCALPNSGFQKPLRRLIKQCRYLAFARKGAWQLLAPHKRQRWQWAQQ
ncbi:hypothetical protein [Vibrio europaeus]|uniref:hypothetical protein n=1 Tax=Vibrio europaeus TaxID=300876 RepID=UPI00233F2706|nr:hypothetical protein [Vibrio europaeus]MDC5818881.1 hypothetical protein [Vibrio europaeus]MDC5871095.1 hypothetical protein [Vibrio europaeus]